MAVLLFLRLGTQWAILGERGHLLEFHLNAGFLGFVQLFQDAIHAATFKEEPIQLPSP
jgi:hypothetical protein